MKHFLKVVTCMLIAFVACTNSAKGDETVPKYMRSSIFPVLVKSDIQNQRIIREIDSIAEAEKIQKVQKITGILDKRKANETDTISIVELPQLQFLTMPVPENFNDHIINKNLQVVEYDSIRAGINIDPEIDTYKDKARKKIGAKISADDSGESVWLRVEDVDKAIVDVMDVYFKDEMIAPKLLAKWYDYNDYTPCDSDSIIVQRWDLENLLKRFNQNMSAEDIEKSLDNVNYRTILEQRAEDMIGKTFVVALNFRFKSNKALIREMEKAAKNSEALLYKINKLSAVAGLAGSLLKVPGASVVLGVGNGAGLAQNVIGPLANDMSGTLAHALLGDGYSVEIFTTLFVLDWDKDKAEKFYTEIFDKNATIQQLDSLDICILTPVAQKKSYCWVRQGKFSKRPMSELVLRATTRAYDTALAELQEDYEDFRIISPISGCDEKGNVYAKIGMKENIQEGDVYEILEINEDEKGTVFYKPIGEVSAVKDLIWNNRYEADIEAQENAEFNDECKKNKIKDKIPNFNKKDDEAVALGHTTFKGAKKGEDFTGYYIRLKDKKNKKKS